MGSMKISFLILHPDVFGRDIVVVEGQFQNLIRTYFTEINASKPVSFPNPHLTRKKLLLFIDLSSFLHNDFFLNFDFERV